MSKALKIVVVAALILSVAAIVRIKQQGKQTDALQIPSTPAVAGAPAVSGLPRLVESGVRHVHSLQDDGARYWKSLRRSMRAGCRSNS